jgi:SPX domain protein involved in polyphosphate accumulation
MSDFETKFISSNTNALKAKHWLDCNFPKDPDFPETIISSVYFDTKDLKLLDEKLESDHIKSKFRIRWYESLVDAKVSGICFYEFKHKVGENRFKRRIKSENIYSDLPLSHSSFLKSLTQLRLTENGMLSHIYPSYNVSYTRYRYCIPGTEIRLCIDYNIHVRSVNHQLIMKPIKRRNLSHCVFELKGETGILPEKLHFLEELGFYKSSFSKYEQCYVELLN